MQGRLGHGNEQEQRLPKHIVALKERVVAVSAGLAHSLALTASGAVWSWGKGSGGRLGHGDEEDQQMPKHIAALQGTALAVSAGATHSLARTADGAACFWGTADAWGTGIAPATAPGLRVRRTAPAPIEGLG